MKEIAYLHFEVLHTDMNPYQTYSLIASVFPFTIFFNSLKNTKKNGANETSNCILVFCFPMEGDSRF